MWVETAGSSIIDVVYFEGFPIPLVSDTSRKHLRTKVSPVFYLTYSKNGGNLGSELK